MKPRRKGRILRDEVSGPVPHWWFSRWHQAGRLAMYLGGAVGAAGIFGAGPLAGLAPFMPASARIAGMWMLLLAALFGAVTYSAAGLYQRQIMRLARRVRAAATRR